MNGPALPRSIRWRLQLGLWKLTHKDEGEQEWSLQELNDFNKDLVKEQRDEYCRLVQRLREEEQKQIEQEKQEKEKQAKEDPLAMMSAEENADVDPLTAMMLQQEAQEKRLQKLELKYRIERARRKHGLQTSEQSDGDRYDSYSSNLTLGVIEKDLKRLQPDHHTYHHSRRNFQSQQIQGGEINFEETVQERTDRLTEILQLYALEHPEIGYRQGMHEISSYLMLVVEMDLFDQESQQQQFENNDLLVDEFLKHDTYHMLSCIMGSLGRAYDVKMSTTPSNVESPMEVMARSILHKIRDIASDGTLYRHLQSLHCPPELYCTRWVRLMFSREVKGWRNVLLLWDVFLDLISKVPLLSMRKERYTRPGVTPPLQLGEFSLMLVLEASAASMILLQRASLLSADNDTNDSIHTLMNVPPLKNILPLTATLLSMMRRIQLHDAKETVTPMTPQTIIQKSINSFTQNAIPSSIRRQVFGTSSTTGVAPKPSTPPSATPGSRREYLDRAMSTPHIPSVQTLEGQQQQVASRRPASRSPLRTRALSTPPMTSVSSLSPRMSALATSLHESTYTVKNYLMAIETASNIVPQSVWDALSEVEQVRKELMSMESTEGEEPNVRGAVV